MTIKIMGALVVSLLMLSACSQQTQEKTAQAVDSAKTDASVATEAVAKEAQDAAQQVATATAEVTQDAKQTAEAVVESTATAVADGATTVATGANNIAQANTITAEQKAGENQQY